MQRPWAPPQNVPWPRSGAELGTGIKPVVLTRQHGGDNRSLWRSEHSIVHETQLKKPGARPGLVGPTRDQIRPDSLSAKCLPVIARE